ncbi:LacI family DNA-binding transcriptional regulator [Plantibacter sp. YIM 135249]|uniref:LacI family DNA-binding transcriptional regulator n=1 Tax=Plantibacter sp. YIM 135249 TaxID=3423918 RepID=UPI003D335169
MAGAISDVAALAGVSKATASRALTGRGYVSSETKERVIRAAAEIGYVPSPIAASLVTGRTKNIGVITPFVGRWFFGEILEGVEAALLDRGYDLTLYNLHPDSPDRDRVFDYFLARKRFDGMLAIGVETTADEVERLLRIERPIVGIGAIQGIPCISIDDETVASDATEHLLTLGHTRIVHLGGIGAEDHPHTVQGRRYAGFRAAMARAGLGVERAFFTAELSVPGGYEAAAQLLRDVRTRPTAVFAATDELAIGVIIAARRLGIAVPAELSVIGIDGHEFAEMFALTTFEQHPQAQGAYAVSLLLDHLDDHAADPAADSSSATSPAPLAPEPWPTRLVVRSSTTRPDQPPSVL